MIIMRTLKIRIINFLLTIILFMPLAVLADGASPGFVKYEAYISDKDGASLYESNTENNVFTKTDKLLKYNTDVLIIDEIKVSENLYYGKIENDSEDYNDYYYINLNKISIRKNEYTYNDLVNLMSEDGGPAEEWIYDQVFYESNIITLEEIDVYKGPSKKYEIYKTVGKDSNMKIKGQLENHYYVEGDNVKGWIEKDTLFVEKENNKIIFAYDTETYNNLLILGGKKEETIIPTGTIIDSYLEYIDDENEDNSMYKVKYNGEDYWIKTDTVGYYNTESIILIDTISGYDDINGETIGEIPYNTEFKNYYYIRTDVSYDSEDYWYLVEYNNKKYWINDSEQKIQGEIVEPWYSENCESFEEDKELYEKVEGKASTKIIPAGTRICPKYTYGKWYYINTKKYNGWIIYDNYFSENDDEESNTNFDVNETNESTPRSSNETNEPDVVVVDNKLSKKETIIIGVITTVLSSLFVLGMILLVNKNSKVKKEAVQANVEAKNEKNN